MHGGLFLLVNVALVAKVLLRKFLDSFTPGLSRPVSATLQLC